EAARAELAVEPRELERRIALLEHEAAEIAAAALRPGEVAEIRARLAASRHGEAIARGASAVVALLAGDDGDATAPGAREQAARAAAEAVALSRLDARYQSLAGRLAGLAAELEDVAFETRAIADGVEHDPGALAAMEERISFLYSLERKYATDCEGLIERADRAADEVGRLHAMEAEGRRRADDATRLLQAVADAAEALSRRRQAAAVELGARIEQALGDLGLGGTEVEVAVGRRPAGREEPAVEVGGDAVAFDATGIDAVVFRIAPNPGEPARALARIASGGELSRIALAIEEVLVDADATPTLVFDEIDAGIGGRSADPVGRTLWVLGRRHRVLCVTHLPQIAAHADAHFAIHKVVRDGRTITEVHRLDDAGRVRELAAMLGGSGGPAAEATARELLERAVRFRVSRGAAPPGL
ncbi:MAG TPA: DNA repair protein RecN, partial [Patescibacteria group bacterium]|nr:DNA repair protein RecN [Patescibacteria group bacterium]